MNNSKQSNWGPIILIVVGSYFFLDNFISIPNIDWDYVWPLFLIAVGFAMFMKRDRMSSDKE